MNRKTRQNPLCGAATTALRVTLHVHPSTPILADVDSPYSDNPEVLFVNQFSARILTLTIIAALVAPVLMPTPAIAADEAAKAEASSDASEVAAKVAAEVAAKVAAEVAAKVAAEVAAEAIAKAAAEAKPATKEVPAAAAAKAAPAAAPAAPSDEDVKALAECIAEKGAKFYGAHWCGYCRKQKARFGAAASSLPYIECYEPGTKNKLPLCSEIRGFPTWHFADGKTRRGALSFEALAGATGCAVPVAAAP